MVRIVLTSETARTGYIVFDNKVVFKGVLDLIRHGLMNFDVGGETRLNIVHSYLN